jgi:hypothetical protein
MKSSTGLLALLLLASPSISYFKQQRPVQASGAGQHYLVVDEAIWKHARADLGDLRLYTGQTEVPYALTVERGSQQRDRKAVAVLQQATVGGKTQFLIDMSGMAEYDRVDLNLSAKNFVAHARVEGQDDPHGPAWAALGESILYDLSRENLGGNSMLRLPRSTYRYLRVTIDGPVKPDEVKGATSEMREEQSPVWREVAAPSRQERSGRDTVLTFDVPENVPVDRVTFSVDPAQPNFRRDVEIQNEKGGWLARGEIDRIHMARSGRRIDSERQEVEFSTAGQKTIKVIIHNGDDPPLALNNTRLQQLERRLYFDAPAQGALTLYYGDEKLEQPLYDYAKLFQRDKNAAAASLGTETLNAAYTGRPDDRPWSDRHPVVLWSAIVAAVLVLAAVALRSMRTAAPGNAA